MVVHTRILWDRIFQQVSFDDIECSMGWDAQEKLWKTGVAIVENCLIIFESFINYCIFLYLLLLLDIYLLEVLPIIPA